MIDRKFIEAKIERIEMYSREMEEIFKFPLSEIEKDFLKYRATERILQLIVDEMIDINNHLIRRLKFKIPDDFRGTFKILAENGVLPEEFAERLAPIVGLRNMLVHRYEKVDLSLFLRTIQKEKNDFRDYIKFIQQYLKKV